MPKVVIGIDQSLKNSGVTVNVNNGELLFVHNIYTEKEATKSLKYKKVHDTLSEIVDGVLEDYDSSDVTCIIERIRLQSKGFLNMDYIKSIGALNALIIYVMETRDIPVFSVDTRAWKSAVVGTSKPRENAFGLPSEKYPTILWNVKHGRKHLIVNYDVGKKKKGVLTNKKGESYMYDDDRSDSIGISFYGFIPKTKQKLEEEK